MEETDTDSVIIAAITVLTATATAIRLGVLGDDGLLWLSSSSASSFLASYARMLLLLSPSVLTFPLTNVGVTTAAVAVVVDWLRCMEQVGWVARLLLDSNTAKGDIIQISPTTAAQLLPTALQSQTKRRELRSIATRAIMDSKDMSSSNRRAAISLSAEEILSTTRLWVPHRRKAMASFDKG
jgi:hypothetical protein